MYLSRTCRMVLNLITISLSLTDDERLWLRKRDKQKCNRNVRGRQVEQYYKLKTTQNKTIVIKFDYLSVKKRAQ